MIVDHVINKRLSEFVPSEREKDFFKLGIIESVIDDTTAEIIDLEAELTMKKIKLERFLSMREQITWKLKTE